MKGFVCRVEDVFQITGRGCVIVPGYPADGDPGRMGSALLLKRPDGSEITTAVRGLDFFGNPERTGYAILLADVTKADVPVGTEVWEL